MTVSVSARHQIDALRVAQPEAAPWLAVLSLVLAEVADPEWEWMAATARLEPERLEGRSLLAGATVEIAPEIAARWLDRLLGDVALVGSEGRSLRRAAQLAGNPLALMTAAINADADTLAATAIAVGADPDALMAVAALAAMPILHALRRRFAAVDAAWHHGWCPVCGGWPTIAEQRGLERTRHLRCVRCGGDWTQPGIRCPYCEMTGHVARGTLIIEGDGGARQIETCSECRNYLKSVSTLRAWSADEIALADVATLDLDLVALERDFTRPPARPLSPPLVMIAHPFP
ncbi:MAG: formate dehydrogenase accessory protein FdhE [Thermomicrobiales bacterium]